MTKPKEKPPENAPPDDAPDPVQAVANAIADALGVDRHAKLSIQRKGPDNDWEHLPRIPTEDFDVETVRERFGGGEYRIRIRGKGGTFIGTSHTFKIAGEPLAPDHAALLAASRGARDGGGSSRDDRMFDLMLAMIARPPAPAPPPIDVAALVTALTTASNSGAERLAEMVGLRNALRENENGTDPITLAMDMLDRGMRIGRREADGGGDPLSRLADAAKPLFGALAARAAAAPPEPGAPPVPRPTTNGGPEVLPINPLVAAFEDLMRAAERGSVNPEARAEVALEDHGDEMLALLDQAIAEAGGIDAMLVQVERMDPRVGAHRDFFRAAVEYLVREEEEDDETDAAGDAPAGGGE